MNIDLYAILSQVQWMPLSAGAILAFVLALFLLLLSGFASGSEISFFSLSPTDLNELENSNAPKDQQILRLREDSERTLATILITNNLVNVTIIMLLNYFFDHTIDFGSAVWLQFLCITVLLTFLLLLFGEIMPKTIAKNHAEGFVLAIGGFLRFLMFILTPISALFLLLQKGSTKFFSKKSKEWNILTIKKNG